MSKCLIFVIIFSVLGVCSGKGGPCYSQSQVKCGIPLHKLWNAQYNKQNSAICGYFEDLHKCTMDFRATCKFKDDLYETDIVKVYTRKPYSCQLMGGNMQMSGEYDDNSAERSRLGICLILILNIIPML